MRCALLLSAILVAIAGRPQAAGAWGAVGHQVVGHVAEHYLTDTARAAVHALLGEEIGLAEVSTWADQVRPERRETAPWHYVNISPDSAGLVMERDCSNGECVVGRIESFMLVLKDPAASLDQRQEALRFVVHFVGDLHQPLHCYGAARGGNDIAVTCLGEASNLHKVWDTVLIERQKITPQEYAAELIEDVDESDATAWTRGDAARWADESWILAMRWALASPRGRPIRSSDRIGRAYADACMPIIDQQLTRAGVRLAHLLNSSLDPQSTATQPATSTAPAEPE